MIIYYPWKLNLSVGKLCHEHTLFCRSSLLAPILYTIFGDQCLVKIVGLKTNPEYGKHWISQCVWIVTLVQKEKKKWQVSGVSCQVSLVTLYMSPVTCHMSLTPTATATNPPTLLTPPLCTAGEERLHESKGKKNWWFPNFYLSISMKTRRGRPHW